MKIIRILLVTLVLISFNATAQYGGMNGGGMYGNRNGLNRNIGNMPTASRKPAEPTEKEKAERVDKYVDKLKTDLNLDDLQVYAIKNEIAESSKNLDKIIKSESSDEDKSKEIEAVSEKTERNINGYLNKEQKEKYKAFIEERKAKAQEYSNRRR
jgi:hypothetical protein